jgi:hypothetical protein
MGRKRFAVHAVVGVDVDRDGSVSIDEPEPT